MLKDRTLQYDDILWIQTNCNARNVPSVCIVWFSQIQSDSVRFSQIQSDLARNSQIQPKSVRIWIIFKNFILSIRAAHKNLRSACFPRKYHSPSNKRAKEYPHLLRKRAQRDLRRTWERSVAETWQRPDRDLRDILRERDEDLETLIALSSGQWAVSFYFWSFFNRYPGRP